jgi:hypothetical protein
VVGYLSLHNSIESFLLINPFSFISVTLSSICLSVYLSISHSTYLLLILFLCRTLTNIAVFIS